MLQQRTLLSLLASATLAAGGLRLWPFPADNLLLTVVRLERPSVYACFSFGYSVLWLTSSFFLTRVAWALILIFAVRRDTGERFGRLPPYPAPERREDLFLVLGEQHHRTAPGRSSAPSWLVVPERGLFTGTMIIGAIGSGKTTACMYPYVEQLLAYQASDPGQKVAGLVLEVKGDFCLQVRQILDRYGRRNDYVEVGLNSVYRYNPLHNDLDAYALAYGIATLMTNLFGRGKEPFWQQASTNLVKFVILLHQVLDDYVTLFQVYEHVINPDKLKTRIAEGERRFGAGNRRIVVDKKAHLLTDKMRYWQWQDADEGRSSWTAWSADVEHGLKTACIPWRVDAVNAGPAWDEKVAQFEAVKRWFVDDWTRIEPKLRTSIIEGISVFLSLFDDNPRVKYMFCPPKEVFDPVRNPDNHFGKPLAPLADLIEQGKIVALNFPIAMNPGLARALGTMLKQDFQRAVLKRVHEMHADSTRSRRPVIFVCDEYQAFATTGENEPSGDEKFFALARQARCIPIVATQSISSLRSTLSGESWRTLLQAFRTKVFLTLSDHFSAQMAADLCGRVERLKPSYTITEAGQDAKVSMLTGRSAAHRTTVSATKSYTLRDEYVFQPKVFAELRNGQAIVLPYDGQNPLPPTYCFLKPHYLDVQTSFFEHAAKGAL